MNKIIISIYEMCMEHEEHEHIIACNTLDNTDSIKDQINTALKSYIKQLGDLEKKVQTTSANFEKYCNMESDKVTPYHIEFEKALENKDKFSQNTFNLGDVKIKLSLFLFNTEHILNFDVETLQDWFEKKNRKYRKLVS